MADAKRNTIISHGGAHKAATYLKGERLPDSVTQRIPSDFVTGTAQTPAPVSVPEPALDPAPPLVVPTTRAQLAKIKDRVDLVRIAKMHGVQFDEVDDDKTLREAIAKQLGPT